METRITPMTTDDGRTADAIYENQYGVWLAQMDTPLGATEAEAVPLSDEDGDYIPAPTNWREMVTEQVA